MQEIFWTHLVWQPIRHDNIIVCVDLAVVQPTYVLWYLGGLGMEKLGNPSPTKYVATITTVLISVFHSQLTY